MAWFVHRRLLDVGSRLVLCVGMLLVCPLVVNAAVASPIAADSYSDQAAAVEKTIRAQIAAFARDDSAAAFSFAAPSIQQRFENPERFMAMVIGGYPMVYRPSYLEFGPLRLTSESRGVQRVQVSDSEAKLWIAHYAVELIDGSWRIAGVQITAAQDKVT